MSEALARGVLAWLAANNRLDPTSDLCLIAIVPGFAIETWPLAVPQGNVVDECGGSWALARVDGDFALRVALVRANGPLIAFCSCEAEKLQADVLERAMLRRVIVPPASPIVEALTGRPASGIDDDRFRAALVQALAGDAVGVRRAAAQHTFGATVRNDDLAAILCAALLGFDDRGPTLAGSDGGADDLWASWIREPPHVAPAILGVARDVLTRRFPAQAAVLERALKIGPADAFRSSLHASLRRLLAPEKRGAEESRDRIGSALALEVARILRATAPARLDELLAPLEDAYVKAGSPLIPAYALTSAYRAHVRAVAQACSWQAPPTDADVGTLRRFIAADVEEVDAVRDLARLTRANSALASVEIPRDPAGFTRAWGSQVAWCDRAARALRRRAFTDPTLEAVAAAQIAQWFGLRDGWNAAFGQTLAGAWSDLFRNPGAHGTLVLSQVMREVVVPLVSARGQRRVFLMVLDGCDQASFLEMLDAFATLDVGLVGAPAGATLGSFFGEEREPKLGLAFSCIPTVTAHARRALFAGEIPNDRLVDDDEVRASDASDDVRAFRDAPALARVPHDLFLKGDLADGGEALKRKLASAAAPYVVAAVFNDVDDELASKARGVLPERTLGTMSAALRVALRAALEHGWLILVTADHGHTPYRAPDIVVPLAHPRFVELADGASPPTGTVVIEKGIGSPFRIAALHQVGAHAGPQHVGYHGGVSLEEMLVPLALLGDASGTVGAVVPPSWWSGSELRVASPSARAALSQQYLNGNQIVPIPLTVTSSTSDGSREAFLERCRAVLASDEKNLAILERVESADVVLARALALALGLQPGRMRQRLTALLAKLRAAGLAEPIAFEEEGEALRWIGPSR